MWYLKYPNCLLEILNSHTSDHSPLKVTLPGYSCEETRQQFRFKVMNNVMDHKDFQKVMAENWNQEMTDKPMYVL